MPDAVIGNAGKEVTLGISMNTNTASVSAAEVHLTYNPQIVHIDSFTPGTALPVVLSPAVIATDSGTISVTLGSQPDNPFTGAAIIGTISFSLINDSPSTISFAGTTTVTALGKTTNALANAVGAQINGGGTTQPPMPSPTCRPRPACLDETPRCALPETTDMCPPSVRPSPTPSPYISSYASPYPSTGLAPECGSCSTTSGCASGLTCQFVPTPTPNCPYGPNGPCSIPGNYRYQACIKPDGTSQCPPQPYVYRLSPTPYPTRYPSYPPLPPGCRVTTMECFQAPCPTRIICPTPTYIPRPTPQPPSSYCSTEGESCTITQCPICFGFFCPKFSCREFPGVCQNHLCTQTPSVTCNSLFNSQPNYFGQCANGGFGGVCFNKYSSIYQGCGNLDNNGCTVNNTNAAQNIFCPINQPMSPIPTPYCYQRPACLDFTPPCQLSPPPPGVVYCPATPTPTPTCLPLPKCLDANPRCDLPPLRPGYFYCRMTPTPTPTPNPTLCARTNPKVTIAPLSQSGNPGQTLTYVASITNTDSLACAPSTFALRTQVSANFTAQQNAISLTIPPTATTNVSFSVTSPLVDPYPDTRSVPVSFIATNTASKLSNRADVAYTLVKPAPLPFKFLVKFAGVKGPEALKVLLMVKFFLQDGSIVPLDKPVSIAYVGNGDYEATTTLTNPFPASTAYTIQVKGSKHGSVRFCMPTGQTGPCQFNQTMTQSGGTFDFRGRPLPAGDLNQDGHIDAADIKIISDILNARTKSNQTDADRAAADVNFDGVVDNYDLILTLQSLASRADE